MTTDHDLVITRDIVADRKAHEKMGWATCTRQLAELATTL